MTKDRIVVLVVVLISCVWMTAQVGGVREIRVGPKAGRNVADGVFQTVNEALRHAESYADDTLWTNIYIAPGVYWIDNPDDEAVRRSAEADNTPYGMKVRLNRTRLIGLSGNPEDVVLACNRGQTQGAMGNFTMLHITGNEIEVEGITFGNYCNVDLDYKLDPSLSRKRRADAIVQAQLIICNGDDYRVRNCRWTSDDPNLRIEWTKRPDPRHVCLMEGCTLNGRPLILPPTPDVPMAVTTPTVPLMGCDEVKSGRWTFDCYKPVDTKDYNWTVSERPAWCFGEGVDGAEGCYGMIQNVRGARMMYTGLDGEEYDGQTLTVELAPCKSAGQGFGSATAQYMDICLKFDTRTLTGYGLRFIRTPKYDRAVDVYLVEYQNGNVTPITEAEKCLLFRCGCKVVLVAEGDTLSAKITNGESVQTLSATMLHPNRYGGVHLQHTGTTGASATVVQSVRSEYK